MTITDDPIRDFNEWDYEQTKSLERFPRCSVCGYPIQQDKAVYYCGRWYCEDCEGEFLNLIRRDYLEITDK